MVEEETQHEIGKMSGMPMDKIGRPKRGQVIIQWNSNYVYPGVVLFLGLWCHSLQDKVNHLVVTSQFQDHQVKHSTDMTLTAFCKHVPLLRLPCCMAAGCSPANQ